MLNSSYATARPAFPEELATRRVAPAQVRFSSRERVAFKRALCHRALAMETYTADLERAWPQVSGARAGTEIEIPLG